MSAVVLPLAGARQCQCGCGAVVIAAPGANGRPPLYVSSSHRTRAYRNRQASTSEGTGTRPEGRLPAVERGPQPPRARKEPRRSSPRTTAAELAAPFVTGDDEDTKPARDPLDRYYTDPADAAMVWRYLVEHYPRELSDAEHLLDPCVGGGGMLPPARDRDVWRGFGGLKSVTLLDLDPGAKALELQTVGHTICPVRNVYTACADFVGDVGQKDGHFSLGRAFRRFKLPDLVVMNPPYSKPREGIAAQFIRRALQLTKPRGLVVALIRLAFVQAAARADLFAAVDTSGTRPERVVVFRHRPEFLTPAGTKPGAGAGNPGASCVAIWRAGRPALSTILDWFPSPEAP